jgi:multidrug efflux system membrane fusion protein
VLFTIDARSYQAEYDRAAAELARAAPRPRWPAASPSAPSGCPSSRRSPPRPPSSARRRRPVRCRRAGAQAALDAARLNLEFTKVRAPIDGRAGRAMVTAGNLVTAGDSASVLTTLVSLDTVFVYFDADESTFLRYARWHAGRAPERA